MVVTAALVVAGGASYLPLVNDNAKSPDAMSGGQSVVYKTESTSELKSNHETVAFAATDESSVLTIDHPPRETGSFPMHRSGQRLAFITERDSTLDQNRLENAQQAQQIRPQSLPVKEPLTKLVEFDGAPFPYDGGGSYHDRRVLLHIPRGFDASRPGVMVLFFHGHRATLERDVRDRQQVPAQISASGMNAVLVAPQFAVDAADSSVGRFSQPGAVARFVAEAADKLARLHGDSLTAKTFANMRIVIVGYSGGFLPTAYSLSVGGLAKNRVRGVVLLDGVYGQIDKFATWIENNPSSFFISSYTRLTKRHNDELEHMLTEHDVAFNRELKPDIGRGGAVFISADVPHRDYVTHAWVDYPIKDIVSRLGDYQLPTSPSAVSHYDASARK